MSKSRRAVLLVATCSFSLIGTFVAGAQAETLADAITLAYQTNPTLQQQRANQRVTDEGVVQAKSAFRPSASVSVDVTGARQDPYGGVRNEAFGSGGTLSISQPLFTGGRASANLSAAEADVLSAREGLRTVEQNVLISVVQAYVDVRRDQERLRISTENVAVLTRQQEETQARFDVGEVTRTDVAQSQARLAASRASLAAAQAQLSISRASYVAVVGQNPTDLEVEVPISKALPTSVDAAFEAAETNNPQVVAARFNEQAATARVASARAGYRPTVSARATLGYDANEGVLYSTGGKKFTTGEQFKNYDRSISGGVTASVPLFTGGLTMSQVRAALERESAARIAVEGAKRVVQQSVSNAWSNLLSARSSLTANEEQVRATRVAYEGVRQEQQVGLRTTLDVLNAQQELRAAEVALVSARRDEYVASASVLQAMGALNVGVFAPDVARYDPKANYNKVGHAIGWVPWEPAVRVIDSVGGAPVKPSAK